MPKIYSLLYLLFSCFYFSNSVGQTSNCPENIGFEEGVFNKWECSKGSVVAIAGKNIMNLASGPAVNNIHTIFNAAQNPGTDPYGFFPRVSPSGGQYSVKLGNDGTGAQAEKISYIINVPANEPDFTITYQYAVVFQDPGHSAPEQPRFTAKVLDVATGAYINCASFDYIATANLPGFTRSTKNNTVYYKSWTPVTIKLTGYGGKQIKLEFATADCTAGGHFGYAYVDVYNDCSSSVSGYKYCETQKTITLKGPSGFDKYNWYSADMSKDLGSGPTLKIPVPPANTRIALKVTPFPGFGCIDTLYVTPEKGNFTFRVNNPIPSCAGSVDITTSYVTIGSDDDLILSYWEDAAMTIPVLNPASIIKSGTYYIKAVNNGDCFQVKPVQVFVYPAVNLKILSNYVSCLGYADITVPEIVAGNDPNLSYTYWSDAGGTNQIIDPKKINYSSTVYVKGTNQGGCADIKPLIVTVRSAPVFNIVNPPNACFPGTVNLTGSSITSGSESGLKFTYWEDAGATKSISDPAKVAVSGTFYIKAVSTFGCEVIKPVKVTINPAVNLTINNPAAICADSYIDLTDNSITSGSEQILTLSYWKDDKATIQLSNPKAINSSGTYFIKAVNQLNCSIIKPVEVTVYPLPLLNITDPEEVCEPLTTNLTLGSLTAGSENGLQLSYWEDISATKPLKSPSRISKTGTYFIKAINRYGCETVKPANVVINLLPKFSITDPKPVYIPATVDISSVVTKSEPGLGYRFWKDSPSNPIQDPKNITKSGIYYITGFTTKGCELSYPINVQVSPRPKAFVPTGFTPSQKENNRLFPYFIGVKTLLSFKVYNKWGNLVFNTNDLNSTGWDGYYKSTMQFFDTYTWYVDGIDELGNYFKQSGNTVLLK